MKKLFVAFAIFIFTITSAQLGFNLKVFAAANSLSNNSQDACAGLGLDSNCNNDTGNTSPDIKTVIRNMLQVFSWLAGVLSVLLIIFGGIKYATSGGSDEAVSSAKKTITYALVGLVIVALSQVIVRYVLAKTTGS